MPRKPIGASHGERICLGCLVRATNFEKAGFRGMSGGISETALPEILGARPDSYAGDVSPQEAWNVLSKNSNAVLVDVRTLPEWNFVGVSDLSSISKEPVFEEWQCYPTMKVNEKFVADVSAKIGGKDTPILFICRSGARSRAAAVAFAAQGFSHAYNVAGGFEGDLDDARHRGNRNGWKAAGLPWKQG